MKNEKAGAATSDKAETKMISIPVEFNGKKYEFLLQEGSQFDEIKFALSSLRDHIVLVQLKEAEKNKTAVPSPVPAEKKDELKKDKEN
jgi:hypothetical protein